jgi:hypothetical protein
MTSKKSFKKTGCVRRKPGARFVGQPSAQCWLDVNPGVSADYPGLFINALWICPASLLFNILKNYKISSNNSDSLQGTLGYFACRVRICNNILSLSYGLKVILIFCVKYYFLSSFSNVIIIFINHKFNIVFTKYVIWIGGIKYDQIHTYVITWS